MLKFKAMPDGCIVCDDGVLYKFDIGGRFVSGNLPIAQYGSNLVDVNAVSLLSSSGKSDIAVFDSTGVTHVAGDAIGSMPKFVKAGGFIRMLTKTGVENNLRYTQTVFIYQTSVDVKERARICTT